MKTDPESQRTSLLQRTMSIVPGEAPLRTSFFNVEPARKMRAEGSEWEHEIRVALPVSYADTSRPYPVLWIIDNNLEAALSTFRYRQVELILVGVGADRVPSDVASCRRAHDLYSTEEFLPDGLRGEYLRRSVGELNPGGGADRFLDFLIDDVRPVLASEYRLDAEDHGLVGHSAGGTFVCRALFARASAFRRYICGSPTLYASGASVFEMEERYATAHDDLPAHVFFGAGEAEITEHLISAWGCVSSMVEMAETLSLRAYPSLRLTAKIFTGESHGTMLDPLLSWGVRSVWGDEILPDYSRTNA